MSCVNLEDLVASLEKIDYSMYSNEGKVANKDIRYNPTDITATAMYSVIRGKDGNFNGTSVKERMGNMFYKLRGIREVLSNNKLFKSIPEDLRKDSDISIATSLAISEVMEAVRGEIFKADKYGVPYDKFSNVSNKDGLSEVRAPFARVAATLGRQIMLSRTGMVLGINDSSKMSGKDIEKAYMTIGEAALIEAEANGYVTLDKEGDTHSIIDDFATQDKDTGTVSINATNVKDSQTIDVRTIRLNLTPEGKFQQLYGKEATDNFIAYLHDTGKLDPNDFSYLDSLQERLKWATIDEAKDIQGRITKVKQLDALQMFLAGIKRVAVPSTFVDVKTADTKPTTLNSKRDVIEPYSAEYKKGVEQLNNTEQHVKQPILNFLNMLAKDYKDNERPLRGYILNLFKGDEEVMRTTLGLYDKSIDSSYSIASIVGKNTSIISPLEDMLGHIESLADKDGNFKTFFNTSHTGANVREYYDSAYMSIQSNKLIRDIVGVGVKEDKTFNVYKDKAAFDSLITYLLDTLPRESFENKLSEASQVAVIKGEKSSLKLDYLMEQLSILTSPDDKINVADRLTALHEINYNMNSKDAKVKNPSFMHNVSLLLAIKDIKDAIDGDGFITTDFLVDPDATANGATLKLGEAVGTHKAKEILTKVGILKGEKDPNIDSIYDYINKDLIQPAIDKVKSKITKPKSKFATGKKVGNTTATISQSNVDTLEIIKEIAYKGKMRDFAKLPAIPLIYGQGKRSSINTIAEGVAAQIGVAFHGLTPKDLTDGHKQLLDLLGNSKDKNVPHRITDKDVTTLVKLFSNKDGLATEIYGLMKQDFFGKDGALTEYNDVVKNSFDAAVKLFNEGRVSEQFQTKINKIADKLAQVKKKLEAVNNDLDTLVNSKKHDKPAFNAMIAEQSRLKDEVSKNKEKLKNLVKFKEHLMIAPPGVDPKALVINPNVGFKLEKSYNIYDKKNGVINVEKLPAFTVFNVSSTHMVDSNNQVTTGGKYLNLFDAKFTNAKYADGVVSDYSNKMAENMEGYNKVDSLLSSMEVYADMFYDKGSEEHTKAMKDIKVLRDNYETKFGNSLKGLKEEVNTDPGVLFGESKVEANKKSDSSKFTFRGIEYRKDEYNKLLSRAEEELKLAKSNKNLVKDSKTLKDIKQSIKDLNKQLKDTTLSTKDRSNLKEDLEIDKEELKSLYEDINKYESAINLHTNYIMELKSSYINNSHKPESNKGVNHLETLNEGAKKTPIINAFLNLRDTMGTDVKIDDEGSNEFNPDAKGGEIVLNTKESELSDNVDTKELQILASHEILHAFTTAWLSKEGVEKSNEYRYLEKAIPRLEKIINEDIPLSTIDEKTGKVINRLKYALKQGNIKTQISELLSIMGAEQDTANAIYKLVGKRDANKDFAVKFKDVIQKALTKVMVYLNPKALKRIKDNDFNVEDLSSAINAAINNSIMDVQESPSDFKNNTGKAVEDNGFVKSKLGYSRVLPEGLVSKADTYLNSKVNYINKLSERLVTNPLESKVKVIAGNIDAKLLNSYPSYLRARDAAIGIFNNSDALQQLAEYIATPNKLINGKANVLTMSHKIDTETKERTNATLNNIHHLTSDFTKDGKKVLSDITSLVPLQYLFKNNPTLGTAKDFKVKLNELESEIADKDIEFVDNLVSMLVKGEVLDHRYYSLEDKYAKSPNIHKLESLLALKALKGVDPDFKNIENIIVNHGELYTIIKDNSMALHLMHKDLTSDVVTKDIQVTPHYEDLISKRVFSWNDRHKYQYEAKDGWKILKHPTKDGALGVAYKVIIDKQQAQGAGVDVQLPQQDLVVPMRYINDPQVRVTNSNVVKAGDTYRLVLTPEEHAKLGKVTAPGENLVRSASNMIHLKETENIRNLVTQEAYTMKIDDFSEGSKQIKDLKDLIKSKTIDHPWFLKVPEDMDYSTAPAEIKAKYKPIQTKMSTSKGFDKKVSWVRKDISHWLTGYDKGPLFQSELGQKMSRVAKSIVSLAKISMAIVNPVKLAKDTASSVNQLTVMGVPLTYTTKVSKEFMNDVKTYKNTKKEMSLLQLKLYGDPNNKLVQAKLDKLSESLKDNLMYKAYALGFVNSLSSDIVSSNSQTRYGLAADVDKILGKVLMNNKGEANAIGKRIVALSKVGFDGTMTLNRVADYIEVIPGMEGKLEGIHEALGEMEKIKNEEDVVGMIRQWTLSPNSEFVKAGIEFNDMIDAISKYTYYTYLVENKGMSNKDALAQVVKAIPDYKEEMPSSMKLLSDYGILMFPSFWARIQRSIYMMAKERPASLIAEYGIESALGVHVESITDANLYNKFTDFGGVLHTPLDAAESGFMYPKNLTNFGW